MTTKTKQTPKPRRLTWLLWTVAVGLIYWLVFRRQPNYDLHTFQTPAGWGYQISRSEVPLIYQPTIPGQAGRRGFTSEAHARRVGERVLDKVRQGQFPPTLQPQETE